MSINHSYLSINHPTSPTLIPTCPSITLPVHQSIIPTCPSIMYEIIIMESVLESGNLSGSFVVSMSKARTTGSCQEKKWNRLHNWSWIRAMTEKSWLRNHGTQSSFTDAKITSWKPSISEIWPTVHVLTSSTRSSISTCCKITTITTICLPPTSLLVTAETSHSLPSTWPSTSPDAAQLVFQQAGDCRGSGEWGKKSCYLLATFSYQCGNTHWGNYLLKCCGDTRQSGYPLISTGLQNTMDTRTTNQHKLEEMRTLNFNP